MLKEYISINADDKNIEIDELKNEFISSRNKIEKELSIKDQNIQSIIDRLFEDNEDFIDDDLD